MKNPDAVHDERDDSTTMKNGVFYGNISLNRFNWFECGWIIHKFLT